MNFIWKNWTWKWFENYFIIFCNFWSRIVQHFSFWSTPPPNYFMNIFFLDCQFLKKNEITKSIFFFISRTHKNRPSFSIKLNDFSSSLCWFFSLYKLISFCCFFFWPLSLDVISFDCIVRLIFHQTNLLSWKKRELKIFVLLQIFEQILICLIYWFILIVGLFFFWSIIVLFVDNLLINWYFVDSKFWLSFFFDLDPIDFKILVTQCWSVFLMIFNDFWYNLMYQW